MVVGEASIHNIMGGMESTGGVRLHNHKRKLKQRFDIIKKLGQGNYGKVQLGINKETGQEVAIKTIKKCKFKTEADLIRIRREIQIMSSVQHPNIIHIYEVFENKEKMVLVMEYAAGGELFDYLSERKGLSEQEARRIFRQISIAVFYCHKHKICHRDLKLENILLDQVGNAKIADFGLSNVFDEQRLLNTFCGSPLYASPEIVKGTPYHGPEVDCWSLGVLLYTLVYGAMPFYGDSFTTLTEQISQSDYFEPKTPSPASPLIKDMLTNCPARRSDIEKICSHWWVNEGYEENCLDIAEELAAQTPVRLDLLLSLVPQSASADKLVVGDQRATGQASNNMSSDTLVPTRCHSVGSLMELDRNNSDRRVREMVEEEPRSAAGGESKRKLETTPSMDETPSLETGVKRKERARKKDKSEDSAPRTHRFTTNRHHSAPIAHPITEEAMEVDPSMNDNLSMKPQLDLRNDETASACLELIKESLSKSPSKERSRTPVAPPEQPTVTPEKSTRDVNENVNDTKPISNKLAGVDDKSPESAILTVETEKSKPPTVKKVVSTKAEIPTESKIEAPKSQSTNNDEAAALITTETNDKVRSPNETEKIETTCVKDTKKLKQKALSLDCDLSNEVATQFKPTERRRSKIFETAEKFNQLAAGIENEKPKKIFIPGVNVGGAKRAFERKASLSSIVVPQTVKQSASKVIIDVNNENKDEKIEDKSNTPVATIPKVKDENLKREEEKKRAVDIITGAIGKPPVQKKLNGSPPITPQSPESKKLALKIPLGPNDLRSATISVSTPVDTKFPFETKRVAQENTATTPPESKSLENSYADEPTMSSKMEITLKSATLPRPRKTSKAEITLSGVKSPEGATAFKSEVEAKIDAFHPQKLRTQWSEVAFPVAAVTPPANRSSSLEPEGATKIPPKERIIPIQVESDHQQQPQQRQTSTPPPKPPMSQRSMSQRSGSLSRQSTVDSDTDSALGSTIGPEPIRKSPREYIIPIAVEGGGYVTPRSGSVEPESKTNTPTSASAPRSRFGRPRRMSSLLSDASEDESPFSTLHRDSDDLLQRHMHRLRSSRPTRQPPEHADSVSSGEDDDDDGFELLTAENLFSTLLSRVRSLTQRLNVDDNRGSSGFPSGRLLGRLGSNSSQGFWGLHEPLSRRLSESQFRRSMSRETDRFGKRDSAVPSNSGTPSSPGARSTPSRESIFEMGSSNTLPRDRKSRQDNETTNATTDKVMKDAQESLEQSFTPSLARRLSRQFIEQTRQSLPRSPSIPREKLYRSSTEERSDNDSENRQLNSTISDQTEYRSRSCDRGVRRTNSLLENSDRAERFEHRSPRRSVSLFDDDDESLPPLPRQVMTLGRKYRDPIKAGSNGGLRRDSFHNYRTEKIQEESPDEFTNSPRNTKLTANSDCCSNNNSNTNLGDTVSSTSARSCETSPTESSSTIGDYTMPSYKQDNSREFENRLLAAENLIKASKLRNLSPGKFDPNLTSSYKDTDKCDKELLGSMTDISGTLGKRRSCIPSLRLRSGSLTREASASGDRRKTLSCSQDSSSQHGTTPERSILSKFFRAGSSSSSSNSSNTSKGGENRETKEKSPKAKGPRRISRFLRPDFFDTPREESQYVKDKEAQKAAENERRKSRFMKKKNENKSAQQEEAASVAETKPEKELKNEANAITRDKTETGPSKDKKVESDASGSTSQVGEVKIERQSSKNSFLQSLEKKLEKFRSNDDGTKLATANGVVIDQKGRTVRENSAPPVECLGNEGGLIKRAISVEDLPVCNLAASTSKRRVSSVLGLFKNDSSKPCASGQRPQNTILSKFKRNAYKGSRSDSVLSNEQTPSTSSKIPMKFAKSDAKPAKKLAENKKSPEKTNVEPNKMSTKEKSPTEKSTTKKSGSMEKQTKTVKKISPEKLVEGKMDKPEKLMNSKDSEPTRKISSPEKTTENKNVASRLAMAKKLSPEKTPDNKQTEAKSSEADEKKIVKTKKNVKSIASLVKNGSVSKLEKTEEGEKKIKKVVKSKDTADKESADGTKKKKIVRVVKKVVKKSDSSDSKSDDKEKTKTLMKKIPSNAKKDSCMESSGKNKEESPEILSKGKDKSPDILSKSKDISTEVLSKMKDHKNPEVLSEIKDISPESANKIKDISPESTNKIKDIRPESTNKIKAISPESTNKIKDISSDCINKIKEKSPDEKISSIVSKTKSLNSPSTCAAISENTLVTTCQTASKSLKIDQEPIKPDVIALSSEMTMSKEPESKRNGTIANNIENSDSDCKNLMALGTAKGIRGNLKLDLSKIPHHTFKTPLTLKKDLSKINSNPSKITSLVSPKSDEAAGKLADNLSKMSNDNITENKIVIDKPLPIKNVTDLQQQAATATELPKNQEKSVESSIPKVEKVQQLRETKNDDISKEEKINLSSTRPTNLPLESSAKKSSPPRILKDPTNDQTEDMFSPVDDNESFDSWSICSADLNHRHDLHSPTSPSYSPSSRGDHPESIIDRIRRKSFYSRFNERKRKSSLNVPPPGVTLPTSSTLPRKYSFNSTRDKDYRKPNVYASPTRRHPERSYSLYNDDVTSYRKSPIERDRYSDVGSLGSFSSDLKSPSDQYGSLGSCYDPLRRYRISPTPDSLSCQRKYQSTDYGLDNDVGSYKSRLSPSFLNDSGLDTYSGRSMLPRKYGSVSSCPEAKTADYYEELLTPAKSDYLTSRKTPVPNDYGARHENGYHNGNLDVSLVETDKWKTYSDKIAGLDLTDGSDGRLDKQTRSSAGVESEIRDLPASSSEPDASTSKAE